MELKELKKKSSVLEGAGSQSEFPDRLRICAERVGNQALLAKKAGISKPTMGDYLANKSDPSRTRLVAIAEAANVSVEWLATGEGPIERSGEYTEFDPAEFLKLAVQAGDLSVRTHEEKEQLDAFRALPPKEKLYILKMMKAMLDAQKEGVAKDRKTS